MLFGLDYRQTKVTDSTKHPCYSEEQKESSWPSGNKLRHTGTFDQFYYHTAWEIPRKVVFLEIFFHWFKCTNYSLYDVKKYFQKYNWKYHLFAVLGTVNKCAKDTGSAGEILLHKKLYFWQSIYLQCKGWQEPQKTLKYMRNFNLYDWCSLHPPDLGKIENTAIKNAASFLKLFSNQTNSTRSADTAFERALTSAKYEP